MPKPIRLQPRDLDILHSLGVARFLTVQALEWLHYPSWRKNWIKHQQESMANRSYYPAPNLYRRLEGLRGGGYVVAIKRTQERATVTFNRLADTYALTEAGADLLAAHRAIDLTTLSIEGTRPRALQNLEHSVGIAVFYAALRSQLEALYANEERPVQLVGWQADHQLARGYDHLRNVSVWRGNRFTSVDLPVLPDATFEFVRGATRRRYFIEFDRATRPLDSWREKAEAYKKYLGSTELEARYGVKSFVLLIIATTQNRIERIAQQVAKIERAATPHYFYAQAAHIHPLTIQEHWQCVEEVVIHHQRIADKVLDTPEVTLAQCAFWIVKHDKTTS